jgi:hypothetical protein
MSHHGIWLRSRISGYLAQALGSPGHDLMRNHPRRRRAVGHRVGLLVVATSLACAAIVPSGDEASARLGSGTRAPASPAPNELKRPLVATGAGRALASVGAKPTGGATPVLRAIAPPPRLLGSSALAALDAPAGGVGLATVRAKTNPIDGATTPPGGTETSVVTRPLPIADGGAIAVVVAGARAPGDDEVGVLGATAAVAPGPPATAPPPGPPTEAPPPGPAAEAEPVVGPPPLPRPITGFWPSEAQWAALRNCESSGRYDIVDASGTYRGAYQFDRPTWASVGGSGDPAAAPPDEQDFRARVLYARRGPQPWPVCGRFLR